MGERKGGRWRSKEVREKHTCCWQKCRDKSECLWNVLSLLFALLPPTFYVCVCFFFFSSGALGWCQETAPASWALCCTSSAAVRAHTDVRFSIHLPSKVDQYQRYHFLSLLILGQTLCGNPDYFGSVKQEKKTEKGGRERERERGWNLCDCDSSKDSGASLVK